ncbi:Tetratricopeptide repeat-domain-containing protein [Flagelloscypha sp. PMI_526]|nr:Tetratricopeptide repeat-domain-containing protein [Flagelloscypha sp. PMI_526]
MANLAHVYTDLGQHRAALVLLERILELRKRVFGLEHPDTLNAMANLALTYSHLGQHTGAHNLYKEAIELTTRIFGEDNPETLKWKSKLRLLRPPVQFNMLPPTVSKKSATNPSRPPISIATKARLSAAATASPPPVQSPSPDTPFPRGYSPSPRESTPPPPPPEPDQSFLPSLTPPPLPEDEPPPAPPLPPDHLTNAAERARFRIVVPKRSSEKQPVPLESANPKRPLDWLPPVDTDAPRNYRAIFDPVYHSPEDEQ